MFIFYIFIRISNFLLKFIYFLFYKKKETYNNDLNDNKDTLKMSQCEKCKTYITQEDIHIKNGKIFCKEHKD